MGGDDRREPRSGDYRAARVGAALALTVTLMAIVLLDALLPDYHVSVAVVATLSGTVVSLLGVELASNLLGRRDRD